MYTSITINKADETMRRRCLASHLGIALKDVTAENETGIYGTGGREEYMVLTGKEAAAELLESVRGSAWAFKASFILDFCGLPSGDGAAEAMESMRAAKCEIANPFILALIEKGEGGLAAFCEEAESADGRAHFLNTYDGEEIELSAPNGGNRVLYYAYRIN